MSGAPKHENAVRIVSTMKRLQRFTADELSAAVEMEPSATRAWLRALGRAEMVALVGLGQKPRRGRTPYVWRWLG